MSLDKDKNEESENLDDNDLDGVTGGAIQFEQMENDEPNSDSGGGNQGSWYNNPGNAANPHSNDDGTPTRGPVDPNTGQPTDQ